MKKLILLFLMLLFYTHIANAVYLVNNTAGAYYSTVFNGENTTLPSGFETNCNIGYPPLTITRALAFNQTMDGNRSASIYQTICYLRTTAGTIIIKNDTIGNGTWEFATLHYTNIDIGAKQGIWGLNLTGKFYGFAHDSGGTYFGDGTTWTAIDSFDHNANNVMYHEAIYVYPNCTIQGWARGVFSNNKFQDCNIFNNNSLQYYMKHLSGNGNTASAFINVTNSTIIFTLTTTTSSVTLSKNATLLNQSPQIYGNCTGTSTNTTANLSYAYQWYINQSLISSGAVYNKSLQGVHYNVANYSPTTSGNFTFSCQAQDTIASSNGAWVNSSTLIFTYSNTTYSGATNETAIYPNSTQPINLSITIAGGDVVRNCSFWNNDTTVWVRNTTVFPTFGGAGTVTAAWIPKFIRPYPNLLSINYWNVSCYDEWGNLTNSSLYNYTVKNLTAPFTNYSAIKINTSVMSGYPNLQGNCTANSTNSTANLSYNYQWYVNQTLYDFGVLSRIIKSDGMETVVTGYDSGIWSTALGTSIETTIIHKGTQSLKITGASGNLAQSVASEALGKTYEVWNYATSTGFVESFRLQSNAAKVIGILIFPGTSISKYSFYQYNPTLAVVESPIPIVLNQWVGFRIITNINGTSLYYINTGPGWLYAGFTNTPSEIIDLVWLSASSTTAYWDDYLETNPNNILQGVSININNLTAPSSGNYTLSCQASDILTGLTSSWLNSSTQIITYSNTTFTLLETFQTATFPNTTDIVNFYYNVKGGDLVKNCSIWNNDTGVWTINQSTNINLNNFQSVFNIKPKFIPSTPNILSYNYWNVSCSDEWGNVTASALQSYTIKNYTAPFAANISTSTNTTSLFTSPRIYGICGANSTNSTANITYNYKWFKDTSPLYFQVLQDNMETAVTGYNTVYFSMFTGTSSIETTIIHDGTQSLKTDTTFFVNAQAYNNFTSSFGAIYEVWNYVPSTFSDSDSSYIYVDSDTGSTRGLGISLSQSTTKYSYFSSSGWVVSSVNIAYNQWIGYRIIISPAKYGSYYLNTGSGWNLIGIDVSPMSGNILKDSVFANSGTHPTYWDTFSINSTIINTTSYVQGGNYTISNYSPTEIGNYTFSCSAYDMLIGLQGNWINASDVQIKNTFSQNTDHILQSLRTASQYYWTMDEKDYLYSLRRVQSLVGAQHLNYTNGTLSLDNTNKVIGQAMNINSTWAQANFSNKSDTAILPVAASKTYSMWIRPSLIYNARMNILALGGAATTDPEMYLYLDNTQAATYCTGTGTGRIGFSYERNTDIVASDTSYSVCSTTKMTAALNNTWVHVAFSYNVSDSKIRIWINGTREGVELTVTTPPTTTPATLNWYYIGTLGLAGSDYSGLIDEFGVYNSLLNDTQIKAIYNAGVGSQYPFIMPVTNGSASIANTTNVLTYPKIDGYCNGYNIINITSQMVYNYTWYYNTTVVKAGQNTTFVTQGIPSFVDVYYPASPGNYTFECFAQDVNSLVWGNKLNATVLMFDDPGMAPIISLGVGTDISSNNKTVFSVGGMPNRIAFNLTFRDINLFQANVSVVCDINGTLYSFEQLDINTSDYNITFTVPLNTSLPLQKCYLRSYSSDDHTESDIDNYDYAETSDGVQFRTTEQNNIIISDVVNPLNSIGITKARDRYSMNFAYSAPSPDRTITLITNNPIYYRENSYYPAHFVVWNPETHSGNWVDFKDKDLSPGDYTVTCVSETECQILIDYNKQDFIFESVGGTNVRETSYEFYIGGQLNLSSRNLYNNQTIKNITVNYTCTSSTCAAQTGTFYKTFNDSAVLYNLSNGTWQLYFSDAGINHYLINDNIVEVNSSYGQAQNWTTSQAQLKVNAIDIKTGATISPVNISIKGNGITNWFNGNSTDAIFNLNATTYEVNVSSPGYYNTTANINLAFMQNYTYNVALPFLATLNFIDEKNLTPFNISSADRIDFSIFCEDGTVNTTVITATTQVFPVVCNYSYFLVSVYYSSGTSSINYVRSLIQDLTVSSTFNVYLINLFTTAAVPTDLIADDMLNQYQGIRIYITKAIGNSTQQIYAGYTDIENKITTYLVQGQIYNIEIRSDNQPIFAAGDYQASNGGTRRIRLYTFSSMFPGEYYSNDVSAYIGIYNDTALNKIFAYALYNDTKNVTDDVTFKVYYANGTVMFLSTMTPDNGGILFMYDTTNETNTSYAASLGINRQLDQINMSKTLNVYEKLIMPINKYMEANKDFTQWFLLLLISILAIYGTMQNSVIVSAVIAIFVTIISTPWFGWLDIPLWLVGIIDLVVFAMIIKTRGNKKLE
jgi:hypothetical protein